MEQVGYLAEGSVSLGSQHDVTVSVMMPPARVPVLCVNLGRGFLFDFVDMLDPITPATEQVGASEVEAS